MLKLAQCKLTSENPLFDWSREMSQEELDISFSTETSASSWAWMAGASVIDEGCLFFARYSSTSCYLRMSSMMLCP